MTSHTISAENLGPIANLSFALEDWGVTVLTAPNGSGKTILLQAVQAAARGEGKLPLRDRTRRGKVEAFGATITIGGTCRHTGGFEVTNLEGRFDLAALVDPRIKTPASADAARIKSLVSMTGVEASVNLFRADSAFEDFDTVVTPASLASTDLVDMAAKIKADYDQAALSRERLSERESGQALALVPPSDLDLDEECDHEILQAEYNEARDEVTRLSEQVKTAKESRKNIEDSQALLQRMGDTGLTADRQRVEAEIKSASDAITLKSARITAIQLEVRQLETEIVSCRTAVNAGNIKLSDIDAQLVLLEAAKATVAKAVSAMPDEDEILEANEAMARTQKAIERGVLIRAAKVDATKIIQHRAAAKEATQKAAKYRDAGKQTDEVLSGVIKCPQLRVESDGKTARLVTDHPVRGKSIPYHDLSDGEKWTIAIDIGADYVGADGLLVISQIGWEGIDGANERIIHQHAYSRKVYILTAAASVDPEATSEIIPISLGSVSAPTKPAPVQPATVIEPAKPEQVKAPPVPQAAKAKPPAAAKKPTPPPEPQFTDDDDIPF